METFKIANIEWIKLKEIGDKTLVLANDIPYYSYFDQYSNNYENSELEMFLNSDFADLLTDAGFDYTKIANGIWPLTKGQYSLYAKNLPPTSSVFFLRSVGSKDYFVQAVNPNGEVIDVSITETCGIRPAFMVDTKYLETFIVEQEKLQIIREIEEKEQKKREEEERLRAEEEAKILAEEQRRYEEEQARLEQLRLEKEKEAERLRLEQETAIKEKAEQLQKEREKLLSENSQIKEQLDKLISEKIQKEKQEEERRRKKEEEKLKTEQLKKEQEAKFSEFDFDVDSFRLDDIVSELSKTTSPKKKKKKKKKKKNSNSSTENIQTQQPIPPQQQPQKSPQPQKPKQLPKEEIADDPILVEDIDIDYSNDTTETIENVKNEILNNINKNKDNDLPNISPDSHQENLYKEEKNEKENKEINTEEKILEKIPEEKETDKYKETDNKKENNKEKIGTNDIVIIKDDKQDNNKEDEKDDENDKPTTISLDNLKSSKKLRAEHNIDKPKSKQNESVEINKNTDAVNNLDNKHNNTNNTNNTNNKSNNRTNIKQKEQCTDKQQNIIKEHKEDKAPINTFPTPVISVKKPSTAISSLIKNSLTSTINSTQDENTNSQNNIKNPQNNIKKSQNANQNKISPNNSGSNKKDNHNIPNNTSNIVPKDNITISENHAGPEYISENGKTEEANISKKNIINIKEDSTTDEIDIVENKDSIKITADTDETNVNGSLNVADSIDSSGSNMPEVPKEIPESEADKRIIIATAEDEANINDIPIESNEAFESNFTKSLIRYNIKENKSDRETFDAKIESNLVPEKNNFDTNVDTENNFVSNVSNEDSKTTKENIENTVIDSTIIEEKISSALEVGPTDSNISETAISDNLDNNHKIQEEIENIDILSEEFGKDIVGDELSSKEINGNIEDYNDEVIFVNPELISSFINSDNITGSEYDVSINMTEAVYIPENLAQKIKSDNKKEKKKSKKLDSEINTPFVSSPASHKQEINEEKTKEKEENNTGKITEKTYPDYSMPTETPVIQHKEKPKNTWVCSCGTENMGKFCMDCGNPKPEPWTCTCGVVNKGKFCMECGRKKGQIDEEEVIEISERITTKPVEQIPIKKNLPSSSTQQKKTSTPAARNIPTEVTKEIKRRDNSTYNENNKIIRKGQNFILNYLGVGDEINDDKPSMADIVNYYSNK